MSLRISPININNHINSFAAKPKEAEPLGASTVSADESYRLQADEYMKGGYFDKAVNLYKKALSANPQNNQATLNLAKTYRLLGDYKSAIPYFEKSSTISPDDIELKTILGECYKFNGEYNKALTKFKEVLSIDPTYDYANRNLLDTQNLLLACYNPDQALKERNETALKNLNQAVYMAVNFFPKKFVEKLQDITVTFDKTEKMGGRSNIAQYEHSKRRVSVTDEYTYANPKLTGAYLIHELGIHAKDNDPYTSVCEEQDAYRAQAKYWLENAHDVYDPEMDYVAELYSQSAKALDDRVAEIYRLRDPGIPETSYNHPPTGKKASAHSLSSEMSPPIKAYDIIV